MWTRRCCSSRCSPSRSADHRLQLRRLQKRLEERKIALELTEAAHEFIGDAAYDPHYGARPLKRYLQSHVETPLAKFIIGGRCATISGWSSTPPKRD